MIAVVLFSSVWQGKLVKYSCDGNERERESGMTDLSYVALPQVAREAAWVGGHGTALHVTRQVLIGSAAMLTVF